MTRQDLRLAHLHLPRYTKIAAEMSPYGLCLSRLNTPDYAEMTCSPSASFPAFFSSSARIAARASSRSCLRLFLFSFSSFSYLSQISYRLSLISLRTCDGTKVLTTCEGTSEI